MRTRFEYADEVGAVFVNGALDEKMFVESVLDATERVLRWIRSQNTPSPGWELACIDFRERAERWLWGLS